MICPHCKKPIQRKILPKTKERVIRMKEQGYSFREIETILMHEGIKVSAASACRIWKAKK